MTISAIGSRFIRPLWWGSIMLRIGFSRGAIEIYKRGEEVPPRFLLGLESIEDLLSEFISFAEVDYRYAGDGRGPSHLQHRDIMDLWEKRFSHLETQKEFEEHLYSILFALEDLMKNRAEEPADMVDEFLDIVCEWLEQDITKVNDYGY